MKMVTSPCLLVLVKRVSDGRSSSFLLSSQSRQTPGLVSLYVLHSQPVALTFHDSRSIVPLCYPAPSHVPFVDVLFCFVFLSCIPFVVDHVQYVATKCGVVYELGERRRVDLVDQAQSKLSKFAPLTGLALATAFYALTVLSHHVQVEVFVI